MTGAGGQPPGLRPTKHDATEAHHKSIGGIVAIRVEGQQNGLFQDEGLCHGPTVILKTMAFVFPLGLDTLALAIALGLRGFPPWRPALLFTIFETAMPVFGVALARVVRMRFATTAVVAGGVVLIGLGIHVICEAARGRREAERISFRSTRSLLTAGLAISTDEIAAGFPLGVSGLPLAVVLLAIAIQTLIVTVVGIAIGRRVRSTLALSASRYAGIGAGVVFAAVGLWLIGGRIGSPVVRLFS